MGSQGFLILPGKAIVVSGSKWTSWGYIQIYKGTMLVPNFNTFVYIPPQIIVPIYQITTRSLHTIPGDIPRGAALYELEILVCFAKVSFWTIRQVFGQLMLYVRIHFRKLDKGSIYYVLSRLSCM